MLKGVNLFGLSTSPLPNAVNGPSPLGSPTQAFDFWSESSICFLHHLDLTLKKRHNGRGYVRLH